jgi:hypothetical protein
MAFSDTAESPTRAQTPARVGPPPTAHNLDDTGEGVTCL